AQRLRIRGPSATQGLSAHRLRRGALRRQREAGCLRTGAARAGIPQLRFPLPLGGAGLPTAGRREGQAMKPTLKAGLKHRFVYRVPDNKTVPFLFPEAADFQSMPKVFATGFMVGLFEWTCMQLMAPHLDTGEGSLGVDIGVSHEAAAPPGVTIPVDPGATGVDGSRGVLSVRQ